MALLGEAAPPGAGSAVGVTVGRYRGLVNESITNLYETSITRTVTVSGPNGSPAVKVKLLHAGAAAAAGVILAPRATAIAAIAGLVKGMRVTIDTPPSPEPTA